MVYNKVGIISPNTLETSHILLYFPTVKYVIRFSLTKHEALEVVQYFLHSSKRNLAMS